MNKRLEERAASRHSTNQMLAEGLTNRKFHFIKDIFSRRIIAGNRTFYERNFKRERKAV